MKLVCGLISVVYPFDITTLNGLLYLRLAALSGPAQTSSANLSVDLSIDLSEDVLVGVYARIPTSICSSIHSYVFAMPSFSRIEGSQFSSFRILVLSLLRPFTPFGASRL